MSLEETFVKVVGRHASEARRQGLHCLGDALGLCDNDAFWSIVMALEYYDSFFRQCPARPAEETGRCIEGTRAAFAVAAEKTTTHAERVLSERVVETSVEIARRLAERPAEFHRETSAVVTFGWPRMMSGHSLASARAPFAPADEGAP